ncbi:MAG: T9SS type A sorting domain-containing protein [Bacteroidota bacterium]
MNRFLLITSFFLALFWVGTVSAQYTQDATIGISDYVDISSTGTLLGAGDENEYQAVLPFDFTFYGTTYEAGINFTVADNGVIVLDDEDANVLVTNEALPSPDFGDAICVMWEDLDADQSVTTDAGIYTQVIGSAPTRTWVIQWNMTNYFADTDASDVITFQAQLLESTNQIKLLYFDVDADPNDDDTNGQSATTGIQDDSGQASQFTFNEFIASGTGVLFDDPDDDAVIIPPGAEQVNLAAILNTSIALNDACQALLRVEGVLTGDFDVDDNDTIPGPEAFTIIVQDDDPTNGPIIDGCGTWQWTIIADPELVVGFTSAWGNIAAEDKTSPELEEELTIPAPIFCDQVLDVDIGILPLDVSRCWIQSGDNGQTINNSLDPALEDKLIEGGGIPNFIDNCSNVEICVNDIVTITGPCDSIVLTRTFTARDGLNCTLNSGESNPPTVYSYNIVFIRPSIDDVEGPVSEVTFNCDETFVPLSSPNQFGDINPAPISTDFPFFAGPNGDVFLDESFCNLDATFEDGPRIQTCPQTYKFLRTYTVIDWCQQDTILNFNQLVKVGDFEVPVIQMPVQDFDQNGIPDSLPLVFSTLNFDCTANFLIPPGNATDNCDDNPSVVAFILPNGETVLPPLGPFEINGAAYGIPAGNHILRYIAEDACENIDTLDVPISVVDQSAPQAICEDGLDVVLGGNGTAVVSPEDIDRASRDDCSDITLLVAFVGPDGQPLPDAQTPGGNQGGWRPSITLDCSLLDDDPDTEDFVAIGLQATDENGNANSCWLDVLVEDKQAPTCIPPPAETLLCNDPILATLDDDLNIAFADDPDGVTAQLDAIFGEANGLDNCEITSITQGVQDTRNSCGVGSIIRTFSVTDGEALTSQNTCIQIVTVLGIHDYSIQFPGDAGSDECIEPDFNGVTFEERGCDLITVTTYIDTFSATSDECYKLRITYELLNWCEYGTEAPPYEIPRDADGDNILEEPTWLHVVPEALGTLSDDIAYLDRDGNRFNGFIAPLDEDNPNGLEPGGSDQPYGTDPSRGAFLYRQFIRVYDDEAPGLDIVQPDPIGDQDGDCAEDVVINFTITDACTNPEDYGQFAQLDAFFGDINGDGELNIADFVPSANLVNGEVTNNMDGTFTINLASLPLGRHAIRIRATDGCGNATTDFVIFEIFDDKAPTPVCINGLTVTLMPDGNGGGVAAVWANEYVVSGSPDCTEPVEYAIYRDSDAAAPDFEGPNVIDTGLIVDCFDDATLLVRIYAIDGLGNNDYCNTVLSVQPTNPQICNPNVQLGNVLGTILTSSAESVAGVDVNVSGSPSNATQTDNNGDYVITDLEVGLDYTIVPSSEDYSYHNYDVSTLDLVFITQHILGIHAFSSPYQFLAADADNNETVTVTDIVSIRRLILGLDDAYQNNSAWRFVDANFIFPNQTNPWATTFPEVFNINNLPGDVFGADFIAVMIGNVQGGYSGGLTSGEGTQSQARASYGMATEDVELQAGQMHTVELTAGDLDQMVGFQGTLEWTSGLELIDIEYHALGSDHVGTKWTERGQLPLSFHDIDGMAAEEKLLSLKMHASESGMLSEMLSIGNSVIPAEAYDRGGDINNLGLVFGAGNAAVDAFKLYQNTPNPATDITTIRWNQTVAGPVELTLQDMNGRTLAVYRQDGFVGQNRLELDINQLPAGVLTYTLVAGEETATQTMVVNR